MNGLLGGGVGGGGGGATAVSASMGYSAQMALAAANRDIKEQSRSHAVEMRVSMTYSN